MFTFCFQIIPVVLRGILRLIEFRDFPEESIPSILNAIFLNVACQQQQQADRYTIYEIFQLSLEKYKEGMLFINLENLFNFKPFTVEKN